MRQVIQETGEVWEGTWDEVQQHAARFQGHRVRVEMLPQHFGNDNSGANGRNPILRKEGQEPTASVLPQGREWIARYEEWLAMPRPVVHHFVDDSREAIYAEEPYRG